MGGAEGGGRMPAIKMMEALREAWREHRSERRAVSPPKAVPEPRVPRSRVGAAVEARLAVRAGVRLEDFLRSRLAKYAASLPVPLHDLPVTVDVEGGDVVVRGKAPPPRTAAHAPPAPPAEPALSRALVDREGPYAAREISDADAGLDGLELRAQAARGRIDEASRAFANALTSGALAARPVVDATAEQLGRPPVPPAAPVVGLRGFAAALLVAEGWRFSGPALAAAGLPSLGVDEALRSAPVPAALALLFALGGATAVLAFAGIAVGRAAEALDDAAGASRRALLMATSLVAALLAGGVAAAAASLDAWAHALLVATVPFAAAALLRWAAALDRRRSGALDAALEWDRDRAREALERGRHAEVIGAAEAELRAVEAELAAARRRVRSLHRRAVDAERYALLATRAEAHRLERLTEGLASALELDRYLFIRLSAERAHTTVERPARAGRLEPAVATERLGIAG